MSLDVLSKQSLNMDRAVSIQFKARKDQRDVRPLTYKGRLVMGAALPKILGLSGPACWLAKAAPRLWSNLPHQK